MEKPLLYSLAALAVGCSVSDQPAENDLPHIVLIMADDMGYGDVEVYNPHSKIPTPHMNDVAAEGMIFTDAHAPSAVCTPTRYGILTGRYCWRTHLKKRGLPPDKPLLIDTTRVTTASMLQEKGYATAIIGKWHLGFTTKDSVTYTEPLAPGPLELGFDYYFGIPSSLNMQPFCYIENHYVMGNLDVPKPDSIYGNKGPMVVNYNHESVGPDLTHRAVKYLTQHFTEHPDQPVYLHFVPSAPHRPCRPPAFVKGKSFAGRRGDMVAEFDWSVGEIIKVLKKFDAYDNTLLIVTSDNGAIPGVQEHDGAIYDEDWKLYDHKSCGDWRGYKTQIWEGGHRVPFIVRWPGKVQAGSRNSHLICLTDMLATFADLTGYKLPKTAGEDSYNILPELLKVTDEPVRNTLVSHSMLGTFSIRKDNWKLILGTDGGGETNRVFKPVDLEGNPPGQLYNLETDPGEMDNLWNDNPEIVAELKELLEKYKSEGKSNFVHNNQ